MKKGQDRWAGGRVHKSPHRLAGVVGFAVLAQHHLGLVLQGLHLLRILQAPCFWTGAAAVSPSPIPPCPSQSAQAHRRGAPSPTPLSSCSPGKKSAHIWAYMG